jgi:glucose/arabinose dehydrogenase/azurin/lysophospholipase L1-like esterase
MFRFRKLLYLTVPVLIFITSCSDSRINFDPASGQRIVFIGNTFAERLQHFNYFEPLLHKSFPGRNLVVRNLGWSADEIGLQPRPFRFGSQDEHLTQQKADIIFACFGMNESFKGPDSLQAFKTSLDKYCKELLSHKYNGSTAPQVILISPIAHENIGGHFPDPTEHNKSLELYTDAMKEVADQNKIGFIDLYHPFLKSMSQPIPSHGGVAPAGAGVGGRLTINGIHLNADGYKKASETIAKELGLQQSNWQENADLSSLKYAIDQKNKHFFYKYRAVNGEYIYGSRKEPWVQPKGGPVYYPSEFKKLDGMINSFDSIVWNGAKNINSISYANIQSIINNVPHNESPKNNKAPFEEQFVTKDGFKVELFASERDFPIEKPVKITFDPKGRLWVSTMPSYPQYLPGLPPNDKIVILEDTDKDGKADKHTVFADSLYLPLGFELGHGGVFVTQAPDFVFLKDTNGDDKADFKQTLLHGFGTEDSHHSISAHTWGPDGALYMHMGTFLHTQVETPYGPVRSAYGETWRYEPRTMKLEPYISYPYANPWGNVFMKDGTHLIADVSTGMNYFAPPMTVATDYPVKHVEMKDFLTLKVRPKTCGLEIVSSRNFPDNMQGDVLFNTFIGFQGVKQHAVKQEGSGIVGTEKEPLLRSTDPQFRPVDIQFGPDGALYIVDWFNIVINHGERALRDPNRDKTHGRIWRVTYTGKKTLKPVDLTSLKINELLEQLKAYEDRTRYRTRIQLSNLAEDKVLPSLADWIKKLDKNDKDYEHNKLEALWVYQQFNRPNEVLLNELLSSTQSYVRAAATRVLYYWRDQIKDAQQRLITMSGDPSPRVRLEAIVSLSHFKNEASVNALLTASDMGTDYYIEYALKESFKHLQPVWMEMFKNSKEFLANDEKKANLLMGPLASEKVLALPGFFHEDPEAPKYTKKPLGEEEFRMLSGVKAVENFRKSLVTVAGNVTNSGAENGRTVIAVSTVPGKMVFDKNELTVKAGSQVTLVFDNPDEMAHNVVIVKPGKVETVGNAADAMAGLKDGYEKNFVPSMPEVLFATPLVNRGERFELKFTAPSTPGEYPFICSFPGHWRMMKGVVRVTK